MLFEQAVSVAPLTLPAHSSIFTGKFPPEHGVRDNGGFFLGPDQVTLAEVLKARGYRTGGFVARLRARLASGASTRDSTPTSTTSISAKSRAVSLVGDPAAGQRSRSTRRCRGSRSRKAQPFFAWIHLYDAHSPYRPPEPFATRYNGHPYNGEIAFADSQVGAADRAAAVAAASTTARSIVVMGDHGESLGDHGESVARLLRLQQRHARAVRDPRAVQPDAAPPRRRSGAIGRRHADRARPARRAAADRHLRRRAWSPLMTGAKRELGLDAYSEAMYPLHHYGWSDLRALRSGRYKVIDAPRPELYDVDRDPERDDQSVRGAAGARRSDDRAAAHAGGRLQQDRSPRCRPPTSIRKRGERLAALGYVGTFVASASDPRTGRADPKDKIGLFNKLGDRDRSGEGTRRQIRTRSFDEIIALLNEVVREDPQVIDAWFMLGTQYLRARRAREGRRVFQEDAGAEAGLRPRGVQPRAGLPPAWATTTRRWRDSSTT